MHASNAYQQYKVNAIEAARPEELTLMLYNGAVRFMKQGQLFIDAGDIEKANNSITRAQDIILELMATLDPRYEISGHLYNIYDYVNRKLIEANLKKDRSDIDQSIELISSIRDAWEEAIKSARGEKEKAVAHK